MIDRATTIVVVEHFMATGGRSDIVAWGGGLVAGEEHEAGWTVETVGESSGPRRWLPGGCRALSDDAPEPGWATLQRISLAMSEDDDPRPPGGSARLAAALAAASCRR